MNIYEKRRFWRKVLIAGVLIVILSLLALAILYVSGMNAAKSTAGSELELEIAVINARNTVLANAAKWTLPVAILASLIMNVSRYRLRKLKKLENSKNL